MATANDVRAITLTLPGVEERPQHGRPSWRTRARWFAVLREDDSLVLWVETKDDRDALIKADPDKFHTTPHYEPDPLVLVRLEAVDRRELKSSSRSLGGFERHGRL